MRHIAKLQQLIRDGIDRCCLAPIDPTLWKSLKKSRQVSPKLGGIAAYMDDSRVVRLQDRPFKGFQSHLWAEMLEALPVSPWILMLPRALVRRTPPDG